MNGTNVKIRRVDAAIVGAGFAGLFMAHKLANEQNLDVVVLEAGGGIGGTWYWNRYPGARSDSISYIYCYMFDEQLLDEWEWSEKFPTQAELLTYLEHVAERFDLNRHIQLNSRVMSATFLESESVWEVRTSTGDVYYATYFITGVGLLASVPYQPELPGLEDFRGEVLHTGLWPENGVDFTGRRVALIGTGSSGMQLTSSIASRVEQLYVLQRSPQYALPAQHHTFGAEQFAEIKARYAEVLTEVRSSSTGSHFDTNGRSVLTDSPEEREATLSALWAEGGARFMQGSYTDVMTDRRANDLVSEFVRRQIRSRINDPYLAEELVPTDHPLGSRRVIVESGYFEAFNQDNVELVDVRHQSLERATVNGVLVGGIEYEVDTIVFATGFDSITGPFERMNIRGRFGTLEEHWSDGVSSYLGLAVSGFPNLFTMTGPGSKFGNMPTMIDHHGSWIAQCIRDMRENGFTRIEANREAEQAWWAEVVGSVGGSLQGLSSRSWFRGSNIPGGRDETLMYFGPFHKYRDIVNSVAADGYKGFSFS